MKMPYNRVLRRSSPRGQGVGAVSLALLGALCLQGCSSRAQRLIDSSWLEANRRAGAAAPAGAPPEVAWPGDLGVYESCTEEGLSAATPPARYLPEQDRVEIRSLCSVPPRIVLVHEFLHALRERARLAEEGLLSGQASEGEDWVQEAGSNSARRSSSIPITPSTRSR